jgi:hypothetical protein
MMECLALVVRTFVFCAFGSSFRRFTRIQLHRIRLLLLIVTYNERRSCSRCLYVSRNSTAQSFSLIKFTICLFVQVVPNTSWNCNPY